MQSTPLRGSIGAGIPPSPGVSKNLDRVLDLVTEHDAKLAEAGLNLTEVQKRLAELDSRLEVLFPAVSNLQDADVTGELDTGASSPSQVGETLLKKDPVPRRIAARSAMERVHRQVLLVSEEQEALRQLLESVQISTEERLRSQDDKIATVLGCAPRSAEGWSLRPSTHTHQTRAVS